MVGGADSMVLDQLKVVYKVYTFYHYYTYLNLNTKFVHEKKERNLIIKKKSIGRNIDKI